jgi:hypothetical protein
LPLSGGAGIRALGEERCALGSAEPLCTLGMQARSAYRVAGYSFPSLSGNLMFLLFNTVRHNGECWVSVHLGRQASCQLQSSGMPQSGGSGIPTLRQGKSDSIGELLGFMFYLMIDQGV